MADNRKESKKEFLKKILYVLLVVMVYSSAVYFFSFITADTDLWGHIKFGKELWESKSLPRFDLYSYTAYGREWINHEWLSELLMYWVYNTFGSPGLLMGKILIGFAIISVLSLICLHRKCHPLIYGIIFVASVFIMSPGFMTRPQVFTFLFTSFFLLVFHLYLERKVNLLWSLPLIMILWVNSHGGFLIGVGLFPVLAACEIISYFIKKKDRRYLRDLILWLILTEVSILINPYGLRLLNFLYESLSVARNISEWGPISIFDFSYMRLKILAILVILSLFIAKKRNRYWEIGIIIIAMVYAFLHQRHTPIFAIIAAPFLTEKLSWLVKQIRLFDRINSSPNYLVMNIFIILLIGYQISYTTNKYIKAGFNIIVDPRVYPVYAVHFLKENNIKGNILLPFEWGEYAIWKLYPDCKVSIDGRFRTVYPKKVIDDHFEALRSKERWMELLDKYPSDIILARRNPLSEKMIDMRRGWIYVYSDTISMIFLKARETQKEILKKLRGKELIYPKTELSKYFP
ncbi:hypothetical protein ACFL7M_03060 [Thermodesulfobacteriota bacterium]